MRIELATSSLPRKCSTTELQQQLSERRDSNPRPSAWKANALSTELLPLIPPFRFAVKRSFKKVVGRAGFEPTKAYASRFTVCPSWPLWYLPKYCVELLITIRTSKYSLECFIVQMLLQAIGEYLKVNMSQNHSPLLYNYTNSNLKRTDHFKETCLKNGLQI